MVTTDQDLGGRREVMANSNQYVVSYTGDKIVLSIEKYTGNIWPKILRTRIGDHVSIDLYSKELVR